MLKFTILDLLYPRRCAICDKVLPLGEEGACAGCRKGIRYLAGPLCCKCGKAVKEEEEYCYDCSHKSHWFKAGAALFPYDYIRTSLYRFKYSNRQEYGRFYARHMALRLTGKVRGWKPQALVPVPLHKKKKRKRGYNQAQVLAEELSRIWQLPVLDDLVIRVKNTRPMKGIEGTERQNNLKKAFKLGKNDVKLNTIIIIDDI